MKRSPNIYGPVPKTPPTSGPWKAINDLGGHSLSIQQDDPLGFGRHVATIPASNTVERANGFIDEVTTAEDRSNACLISAAPELYAALKLLLQRLNHSTTAGIVQWEEIPKAIAALAKADGAK